jgi:hypothetical protein
MRVDRTGTITVGDIGVSRIICPTGTYLRRPTFPYKR